MTILIFLVITLILFGIFLILNWNYIINPQLNPAYDSTGNAFGYNEHASKFSNWGVYYPLTIFPYIIFLQFILLIKLFIKKNIYLTLKQWIISLMIVLLFAFSQEIFEVFYKIFNRTEILHFGFEIKGLRDFTLVIIVILMFFLSFILTFISKFKEYRVLLILTWISVSFYIILFTSWFLLFFD